MTPPSYLRQFIPPPPTPAIIKIPNLPLEREEQSEGWYFGLYYKSTTDSNDPLAACYVCIEGKGGGGGRGRGNFVFFTPFSSPVFPATLAK